MSGKNNLIEGHPGRYPLEVDYVEELNDNENIRKSYSKSRLSDDLLDSYMVTLKKIMDEEELFKDENISLESLAKCLKVAPAHLTQMLNIKIGCNFYSYINGLRASFARTLIDSGNVKIYDVYIQSGFNNRVSFNRYFKKLQGCTPSEYIKQLEQTRN